MYLTVSGVFGAGFLASFPPVFVVLCCLIENTNSYLNGQLDAYRFTESKRKQRRRGDNEYCPEHT